MTDTDATPRCPTCGEPMYFEPPNSDTLRQFPASWGCAECGETHPASDCEDGHDEVYEEVYGE